MGERKDAKIGLVRESEGKRKLRRPRHQWVDSIRVDLQEIGWGM
jgi:hypothetical protein